VTGVEPLSAPLCAGPDPNPRPPRFAVPDGAVDCHAHICGPVKRYPFAKDRIYTPPDALLSDYLQVLRTLGVTRGVLVQPSGYGFDNSCLVDALAEAGPNFRGIAVVDPQCSDEDLDQLHAVGVRGLRFNVLFGGGAKIELVPAMARRIQRLGWHVQLLIDVSRFQGLYDLVQSIPVPVVVDHMGHVPVDVGVTDHGFQTLLALLAKRRCWVKLSGSYRMTRLSKNPYADVNEFAQALVRVAPNQCLWASDWPHPQIPVPLPNDGDLMDQLADWIPVEHLRKQVLVENPTRLYGF